MASNQQSEATGQNPDMDPNLENILSQILTEAFQNQSHNGTPNHPLSLPINETPLCTTNSPTTTPQQHLLEFHLYARNAVALIPSQESNAPIHVFIPASQPPLSHTEFHVVPEHGSIANPRIHFYREVQAQGPVSWYVSPGLRVVPVELQNRDAGSGEHVIEGGDEVFYASDAGIKSMVEQMHANMNTNNDDNGVGGGGGGDDPQVQPAIPHLLYQPDAHLPSPEPFDGPIVGALMGGFSADTLYAWAIIRQNPTPHSIQDVLRFIQTLPKIEIDELDGDTKECGICRGFYGEPVSFDGGKPEKAVQLPCGHIFGKGCLKVLSSPKCEGEDSGWGERLCPLCRRVIEGIGASA